VKLPSSEENSPFVARPKLKSLGHRNWSVVPNDMHDIQHNDSPDCNLEAVEKLIEHMEKQRCGKLMFIITYISSVLDIVDRYHRIRLVTSSRGTKDKKRHLRTISVND
jgi:hypothetical protein